MNRSALRTIATLFAALCSYPATADALVPMDELPDAPSFRMQSAAAPRLPIEPQGTARVDGVVLDNQDAPVPEAKVTLAAPGKLGERTEIAGSDGSFSFTGLAAGEYRIIILAPGLEEFTSAPFAVKAGETIAAPKIALRIATTTSVDVTASPDQIALAEVHEQEKQRVLGVFPNFYTSYIWDAQPMPVRLKFNLALRSLLDPVHFILTAGVAGIEQANDTYPGYGDDIEGYGKRYGAALADSSTGRIVGSAILPAILHQDPRYFYQGSGGFRSRAWHAAVSVLVTRGDNGKPQPNVSHLLGSLAGGAVANLYHPESSRGVGLTFRTFGISTAANVVSNLFREFVFRSFVPSVPIYATGKK